jgi:hypothetical protein
MIDTDEYIEMWDDHLLSSQGCADLTNALIAEVKRLREEVKMLWQYVDTELMYTDGLLTVEGEMIE